MQYYSSTQSYHPSIVAACQEEGLASHELTTTQLEAIAQEIELDPAEMGYANKSDGLIAAHMAEKIAVFDPVEMVTNYVSRLDILGVFEQDHVAISTEIVVAAKALNNT